MYTHHLYLVFVWKWDIVCTYIILKAAKISSFNQIALYDLDLRSLFSKALKGIFLKNYTIYAFSLKGYIEGREWQKALGGRVF